MKEIGEYLKTERKKNGVSISEASDDLNINETLLKAIEDGNSKAFKDIFELKEMVRNYSKYLGLNKEDLVDEFNEYLFDVTSRISLSDIKKAKKERNQAKRIKSPYTIDKKKFPIFKVTIILIIIILVSLIVFLIYSLHDTGDGDFKEGSVITERR